MALTTVFCVFSALSGNESVTSPRQTSSFLAASQMSTTSVPFSYSTTRVVVDTGPLIP